MYFVDIKETCLSTFPNVLLMDNSAGARAASLESFERSSLTELAEATTRVTMMVARANFILRVP